MANAQLRPAFVTGSAQLRAAWTTAGAGVVDLAAAAAAQATAAADLTHATPLEGAAASEATAAATITHDIPLASAGLSVATADGAMSVSIPLAGSALAQALAAAGMTHAVPLAGTGITTYTRPDFDHVQSTWTASSGTDLFAMVNEVDVNDSTYIQTASALDNAYLRLGAMPDPGTNSGHRLVMRSKASSGSGFVNYSLYTSYAAFLLDEAAITSGYFVGGVDYTTNEKILPVAQAALITDYSALCVSISGLNGGTTTVSQVYLKVTQSAVATATGDLSVSAAGAVDLAATATATSTATGGLSLSIPLSGSAVAQALAAAGITHAVPLAGAAQTGHTIYARPDGTTEGVGFTPVGAATIHECLNKPTPNDSTYIYGVNDSVEVSLGDMADPGISTGHVVRFRAKTTGGWAAISLYQGGSSEGGTLIANKFYAGDFPTVWTDDSLVLTEAQANSITNYSDLRITVTGLIGTTYYSSVEFTVDVPGVEATGALTHAVPLEGAAVNSQTVRPISDLVTGSWVSTGANLWSVLDETVTDDTDYISTTTDDDTFQVLLAPIADPLVDTGHKLYVRAGISSGSATLFCSLYQGTTLLKIQALFANTSAPKTFTVSLSTVQAATITDYSDLRVVLSVPALTGKKVTVSAAYFLVENGAIATSTGALSNGVNLSGNAASEATAVAAVSINVSLSGVAIAEALASATLTTDAVVPLVDLAANATAAATASGELTHAIPLSGASLSVATADGDLSHDVPLAGSAAATSLTTGGLDVKVSLSGAALAEALAAGGMTHIPSAMLSGAATGEALADGSVTLRVTLSAAALADARATGALSAYGLLTIASRGWKISAVPRSWNIKQAARSWAIERPARNWRVQK